MAVLGLRFALHLPDFVNSFTFSAAPRSTPIQRLARHYWRLREMRFYGLALLASAAVLGACGGGENKPATADTTKAPPAAAPGAPATGAPAAGAKAPIAATGDTVTVKMISDDKGYRFDPANVTIKSGQAVKFVDVSGGPHNVAFDPATVPADSKDQLNANMVGQMSE